MGDLSLSTWANIAEIIGAGSIVSGLIFGGFQLRQYRVQQRNTVAINLAQTFYNHSLAKALALLQSVPDGIGLQELRSKGPEYERAVVTVITTFETMGLLVFKRIAPRDMVMDLSGGVIGVMCRKLRNLQNELREEQQQPSWGEWFEWLGDQALKYKSRKEPAHIRYRDWKG
jgi:hypothetical protein